MTLGSQLAPHDSKRWERVFQGARLETFKTPDSNLRKNTWENAADWRLPFPPGLEDVIRVHGVDPATIWRASVLVPSAVDPSAVTSVVLHLSIVVAGPDGSNVYTTRDLTWTDATWRTTWDAFCRATAHAASGGGWHRADRV